MRAQKVSVVAGLAGENSGGRAHVEMLHYIKLATAEGWILAGGT